MQKQKSKKRTIDFRVASFQIHILKVQTDLRSAPVFHVCLPRFWIGILESCLLWKMCWWGISSLKNWLLKRGVTSLHFIICPWGPLNKGQLKVQELCVLNRERTLFVLDTEIHPQMTTDWIFIDLSSFYTASFLVHSGLRCHKKQRF